MTIITHLLDCQEYEMRLYILHNIILGSYVKCSVDICSYYWSQKSWDLSSVLISLFKNNTELVSVMARIWIQVGNVNLAPVIFRDKQYLKTYIIKLLAIALYKFLQTHVLNTSPIHDR